MLHTDADKDLKLRLIHVGTSAWAGVSTPATPTPPIQIHPTLGKQKDHHTHIDLKRIMLVMVIADQVTEAKTTLMSKGEVTARNVLGNHG